eukprot:TRINITY_DN32967_c0_g1_i1.p1 TRINITY_DN32967_c0_g1~~TRINITY_DN32967_c0_g1_i1.p1  ORF type:complete len:401 (-),score=90.86 TRINITY_DN32967_c0_g1_i1:126-1328(-)
MGVDFSKATQTYDDGSIFRGQCQQGRFHGKGVFKFGKCLGPDDRPQEYKHKGCWHEHGKYDGAFQEGFMHGQGIYYYPCGGRYQGQFRSSLRDGYGVYTWPDGNLYEGHWRQDQPEGEGRVMHNSGELITTTFAAGEQDFDEDGWRDKKQVQKITQAIEDDMGRKGVAGAIADYAHLSGATKALADHAARRPPGMKMLEPHQNLAHQAIADISNQVLLGGGRAPPPRPPPPPPVGGAASGLPALPADIRRPSLTGFGAVRQLTAPDLPPLPPFPPTGHRLVTPTLGNTGGGLALTLGSDGTDVTQLPMLPPMAPLARPPAALTAGTGSSGFTPDARTPPLPPPGFGGGASSQYQGPARTPPMPPPGVGFGARTPPRPPPGSGLPSRSPPRPPPARALTNG